MIHKYVYGAETKKQKNKEKQNIKGDEKWRAKIKPY